MSYCPNCGHHNWSPFDSQAAQARAWYGIGGGLASAYQGAQQQATKAMNDMVNEVTHPRWVVALAEQRRSRVVIWDEAVRADELRVTPAGDLLAIEKTVVVGDEPGDGVETMEKIVRGYARGSWLTFKASRGGDVLRTK